jgi:hypothetical protein
MTSCSRIAVRIEKFKPHVLGLGAGSEKLVEFILSIGLDFLFGEGGPVILAD